MSKTSLRFPHKGVKAAIADVLVIQTRVVDLIEDAMAESKPDASRRLERVPTPLFALDIHFAGMPGQFGV